MPSTSQSIPVSGYIPIIRFRPDAQTILDEGFINARIQKFFDARKINKYSKIHDFECITLEDFKDKKNLPFYYFYDVLLRDIVGTKGQGIAYTIVYDSSLTPLFCESSATKYGVLSIGKKPFFYLIFVDINEAVSYLKTHKIPPVY